MAAKNGNRPEHSGFDAPVKGKQYPQGTVWKKNKDGTISPVTPKKKK